MTALSPVSGETLTDTLIVTYQDSPLLAAQRAILRSVDEQVALARAGKRPNVTASASADASASETNDWRVLETYALQLSASLTIYDYGQTKAAVNAAQAAVAANRATLRSVEQNILLQAVTAYVDVRRDVQSVIVAENNVQVLSEQVRATNDRFELGEVTRTDVSLAEARLASARANLAAFQGQLQVSREAFEAVVGRAPGNLAPTPPLPALPGSVAEAEAIAMAEQPALESARFLEQSAAFDLRRARAARGPSVTVDGNVSASSSESAFSDRSNTVSAGAGITGSIPLIQGGTLSALVRQAQAVLDQRRFEVQDTARTVRQDVATAFSNLRVARATIVANREEVRAARVAFEGVREEATLGARTTLDVLDLEQDLRDAEFTLASSLRDEYVAAYQLLAAMGLLSVEHLNLGIPTYDPDIYYSQVQNAPYSTVEGTILDKLRDRYAR